jgi:RNA polymerase sigma-70 factor (ECF subfamily)
MIGGSQDALAALYDRHGKAVFSAAMRTGRDPSIAAEVVQETFLTLWNRAELFDATRGTLPGWLRTIARNRAVDHLRAGTRQGRAMAFSSLGPDGADQHAVDEWLTASGELVGMAAVEPGPEAALASKEARSSIEEALASLGPLERSVITLAYQGGLSQSEIADRLGWPLGTVKTRTRRALSHLRERLEQQQHDGHDRGTPASIGPRMSGRGSLKAVAHPKI